MPSFLVRPEDVGARALVLRGDEAQHLVRARRHRVGDEIEVIDGCGRFYRARIAATERASVRCEVLAREEGVGESAVWLSLAPALIKGPRFDFVVEKATEVGVAHIAPVFSERGVARPRSDNRLDRWGRLVQAAAKQCGRSRLPTICRPGPLREVHADLTERNDVVLMATASGSERALRPCLAGRRATRVALLVGPEGGFSPAEELQAQAGGAQLFRWGRRALRADTASIVLAALVLHEAEQAFTGEVE